MSEQTAAVPFYGFSGTLRIEEPKFNYTQQRWAKLREENTEDLSRSFRENPNQVKILNDPKLATMPLVVLRKEHLDRLINLLRDLQSGQLGIEHELTAVRDVSELIAMLAEEEGLLKDDPEKTEHPKLNKALRVFVNTYRSIAQRRFVFVSERKRDVLPTSSDSEKASLPDPDND